MIKAVENIHDFEILLLLDSDHRYSFFSTGSVMGISGPRAMACWKSSNYPARQHQIWLSKASAGVKYHSGRTVTEYFTRQYPVPIINPDAPSIYARQL